MTRLRASLIAIACLAGIILPGAARAFETPAFVDTAAILGAAAKGPGYSIAPKSDSDGLMWTFDLTTRGVRTEVVGEAFLRMRLREIAALQKLEDMSRSEAFLTSLGEAAAAPLRFGADLVTAPGETLKRSASGIANMVDRVGAAASNRSANRDNPVTSLLGVDAARRALAVELGVDPYTDFAPLAQALTKVASASAAGGLSVKALTLAIPGGAGIAVSSVGTAETARDTLRDKTSAQILQQVAATLASLKVPAAASNALAANRNYTPADLLVIATSLQSMAVRGSDAFVINAAGAGTREEAFFNTLRISLIARNTKNYNIESFVSVGGFALNRLKDGRILALMPLDEIVWTERTARMFDGLQASIANMKPQATAILLVTTGDMTATARKELTARKWQYVKLVQPK